VGEVKKQLFLEIFKSLLVLNVLLLSGMASLVYKREWGWVVVSVIFLKVLWVLLYIVMNYMLKVEDETCSEEEKWLM
jgi:hypothetical protein